MLLDAAVRPALTFRAVPGSFVRRFALVDPTGSFPPIRLINRGKMTGPNSLASDVRYLLIADALLLPLLTLSITTGC